MGRVFPLLLMLLLGLVLSVYLAVPRIAGQIVVRVFESGTGCDVSLKNPKIRFRTLKASIEDVLILCPGEKHGLRAKKIIIGSSWDALSKKKILLSPLEIEGVRAESYSLDSSLLKLLNFILKKKEVEVKEKSSFRKLFDPIISGWKVWVPSVLVSGLDGENGSLVFGTEEIYLRAFNVEFKSSDDVDLPEGVVVLQASSSKVLLEGQKIETRELGSLEFLSHVSDGVLSLRKAFFNLKNEEDKELFNLNVSGGVLVKKDQLDLRVDINSFDEGIKRALFPEFIDLISGEVNSSSLIKGPYKELKVNTDFSSKGLRISTLNKFSNSFPEKVSFSSEFNILDSILNIRNLEVEKYLRSTELKINLLSDAFDFNINASIGDNASRRNTLLIDGALNPKTNKVNLKNIELQPMHLEEFTLLLRRLTNFNLLLFVPTEAYKKNYFLTSSGNLDIDLSGDNSRTLNIPNMELVISAKSAEAPEDFIINAKSLNSIINIKANLNGIQREPFFQLSINGENLDGSINLNSFELRQIPFLNSTFRQGVHLASLSSLIKGSLSSPELSLNLDFDSYPSRRRLRDKDELYKSKLAFNYSNYSISINAAFFNEKGNFSCNPISSNNSYDCSLTLNEYPLKFNLPSDSGVIEEVLLTGSASYKGNFSDLLSGTGYISIKEIKTPADLPLPRLSGSIEATLQNRSFNLVPFYIHGADNPLVIKAHISEEKGYDVSIQGDYLISGIISQLKFLESISGLMEVDFKLQGSLNAPSLSGLLNVKDAEFALPLGDGVTGGDSIFGSIKLDRERLYLEELSGNFGDGKFKLSGELDNLFSKELRNGNFNFSASQVRLEPTKGLSFEADIETEFIIEPLKRPLFKGLVSLEDALYENSLSIENIISTLTSLVLGGFSVRSKSDDPTNEAGIDIDLHINAPAGLYLDTSVLTAEFIGGVHLANDLFSPQVTGEIQVVDGQFSISQTDFRIISGRAVFDSSRGSLNPILQLSSEGDLRSITGDSQRIYLTLGGTLRTPRVKLTSDGQATQRELAQQLGMGGGGGSQMRLIDERSGRNVGFREVINPSSELSFTERFVGLTGVDDVRLETVLAVRTGELVPQVVGGRPLPFDLRGTISSELAGDRTNQALVEYQLSEVLTTFSGWRSQSVLNPGTTSAANFLFGIRFDETFKGITLFETRVKEE